MFKIVFFVAKYKQILRQQQYRLDGQRFPFRLTVLHFRTELQSHQVRIINTENKPDFFFSLVLYLTPLKVGLITSSKMEVINGVISITVLVLGESKHALICFM